jgi:hypothetical protein
LVSSSTPPPHCPMRSASPSASYHPDSHAPLIQESVARSVRHISNASAAKQCSANASHIDSRIGAHGTLNGDRDPSSRRPSDFFLRRWPSASTEPPHRAPPVLR